MTIRLPETVDVHPQAAEDCLKLLTRLHIKKKEEVEKRAMSRLLKDLPAQECAAASQEHISRRRPLRGVSEA